MYRTILLPLDGSTVAEQAMSYAETLARASGARLLLLRATRTARGPARDRTHAAQAARAYLAGVAAQLDRRTVVETVVFPAAAVEAIRRETHVRNVDLIVMTAHGQSGPGRDSYGRVAGQIMRRVEAPVLLVPTLGACSWSQGRRLRVLVPLDGCVCYGNALRYADDLAKILNAELLVLRMGVPPPGAGASVSQSSKAVRQITPSGRETITAGPRSSGQTVPMHGAAGHPDSTIATIAHTQGADIAVLPVHDCGSLPRREWDSAPTEILQHVRIPVLLVGPLAGRPPAPARPAAGT